MLQEEIRISDEFTNIYITETETEKPLIRKQSFLTKELKNVFNSSGYDDITPLNCRYSKRYKDTTAFIIEEQPALRTIFMNMNFSSTIEKLKKTGKFEKYNINESDYNKPFEEEYRFQLSFPYIEYLLFINNNNFSLNYIYLFFRLSPISNLNDYLLKANLLNINNSQFICIGSNNTNIQNNDINDMSSACQCYIDNFWSSPFNQDYINNYQKYSEKDGCEEISDYISWQYYSKIDPMFIFKMNWIPYDKNFEYLLSSNNTINYDYAEIKNIITNANKEKYSKSNTQFLKTRFESDYLGGMELSEGDSILFKSGKESYVSQILLNDNEYKSKSSILQLENGKDVKYKLTSAFKNYIKNQYINKNYLDNALLPNGQEIKIGNILKIETSFTVYKKIKSFRKGIDNSIEVSFCDRTNDFYILENMNANLYNIENIQIHGKQLKEGDKFYRVINSFTPDVYGVNSLIIFDEIEIKNSGKIYLLFINPNNQHEKSSIEEVENDTISEESFSNASYGVIRSFFKLYSVNYKIIKNKCFVDTKYDNSESTFENISEYLFKDDNKTLEIPSPSLNISFSIGDKVVVSDWNDPINMLIPKTIMSFIINEETSTISFVLIDKKENITQVPYIVESFIHVGKIRKITNYWNNINAGSKIKAHETKISNFPKKDTNIIIGFITDTGIDEPLVLCSNCCTLWFSDLIEKFTIIPVSNSKWSKYEHCEIDISKIKIHPSDIISIKNDSEPYGIVTDNNKCIERYYLQKRGSYYCESIGHDKQLFGIITPRYTVNQQYEMGFKSSIPTLHGSIIETENTSIFSYLKERNV